MSRSSGDLVINLAVGCCYFLPGAVTFPAEEHWWLLGVITSPELTQLALGAVVTQLSSWVELSRVKQCDHSKNSTQLAKKVANLLSSWNSEHVRDFTTNRKLAIYCPVELSWAFRVIILPDSSQLASWVTTAPDASWVELSCWIERCDHSFS